MAVVKVAKGAPQFGLVIVGDEILLGKREDSHFSFVRQALKKRGLSLNWVRIVGDEPDLLAETFREAFASGAVVFSCGGIGATPDDLTRQAVAEAVNLPLEVHPEGLVMLQEKFGDALNEHRQCLVEFPKEAVLIPNPVNQVPGFSVFSGAESAGHFVPGFPQMAEPMIEWVLEMYYAAWFREEGDVEALIRVLGVPESELISLIEAVAAEFPAVKVACLPDARRDGVVELGVRGERKPVQGAEAVFAALLDEQGMRHTRLDISTFGKTKLD